MAKATPDNGNDALHQQVMFPQPADFAAEIIKAMNMQQQQQQQQPQAAVESTHVDPSMASMLLEWDRLSKIQGQVGENARHGVGVRMLDMARSGKRPLVRDYERITEDTPLLAEAYLAADVWSKGRALFPEFIPSVPQALKFLGGLLGTPS